MENSIGKDIILLKDFTEGNLKRDKLENYKGSYKMGYFYCKDIQQAIEHILSDYKRVLKENEELKNDNKYLRERETYLEKRREDIINFFQNQQTATTIPIQKIKNIIDRIDCDIKKTKEINKDYNMRDWEDDDVYKEIILTLQELLDKED